MKSKKLVLISTFCDTQKKIDIFVENVKKIKRLGIDVMAISPNWIHMPDDVIKECDFFFYTKENPVLDYPIRQFTHWYSISLNDEKNLVIHRGFPDYGWASLYQIKKLLQFALTYDYEIFCNIIYDLVITEEMELELVSDQVNVLHRRLDPIHSGVQVDSAHFMFLDRKTAYLIEKEITYEAYLPSSWAEMHVKNWVNKYNLRYIEPPIRDLIYYWDDRQNHFDYGVHDDFKFFFSKNPEMVIWVGEVPREEILVSNLRLLFYDFKSTKIQEKGILVQVNEKTYEIYPTPWKIVEFEESSQEVNVLKLTYDNQVIDLTNIFTKTKFNQIFEAAKK